MKAQTANSKSPRPRRIAGADMIDEGAALLRAGGMLRTPHVCALTGQQEAQLYAAIADGTFPQPAVRGHRSLWKASAIRAYLDRVGG